MSQPSSAASTSNAEESPRFLSLGDGNEILQVALDAGDSVLAGERAFCYRGLGLQQEILPFLETGTLGRALGWMGLKNDRVVTWTNEGTAPTYIGLCAPIPGKVIPVNLQQSGALLVKPQMFLCSVSGNQVSAAKLRFTPEGQFPQHRIEVRKILGTGVCYIQAGGTAVQKTLGRAETMVVEIGCVAALSETCKIVTEERTGIAHEPPFSQVFTVKITGPGTVFVQSTHVGRLSRAMTAEGMSQRTGGGGVDMAKVLVATACIFMVLYTIADMSVE